MIKLNQASFNLIEKQRALLLWLWNVVYIQHHITRIYIGIGRQRFETNHLTRHRRFSSTTVLLSLNKQKNLCCEQ